MAKSIRNATTANTKPIPAVAAPSPQPAEKLMASHLIKALRARLDWADRDRDKSASALCGDPTQKGWASPEELLRRMSSWGTDLARHHAKAEVIGLAVAILDGSDPKGAVNTFPRRMAYVQRLCLAGLKQLANERPWEFGSSDQVSKGIEYARHRGMAEGWSVVGEAVDDFLAGAYVDDVTPAGSVAPRNEAEAICG